MDKTQSLISSAGTPEKSPAKCSRRRHRYLKSVTGVVVGIIVLNAAVSLLLAEWRQPVMVSFDMAGTVNSFMSQAAAQALDEARIKALTARFNRALSDSLTAYQRSTGPSLLWRRQLWVEPKILQQTFSSQWLHVWQKGSEYGR
ncbi:TrbI F-type domain-containing protein [Salmonella enterica]|uniref:TrbI F-type domain-containing protein n=1 Tax=Salmonella enterica TaxID=28901 RepID=UPI000AE495DF